MRHVQELERGGVADHDRDSGDVRRTPLPENTTPSGLESLGAPRTASGVSSRDLAQVALADRARAPRDSTTRLVAQWPAVALALGALPMLLFFLLPLVALLARVTPGTLLAYLADGRVAAALRISVVTTALTLALTVVGGTPVAYLLARYRFPGRGVLDTLLDLPMVLPPAVAGIALLVTFGRTGLLGRPLAAGGISLAFSELAVVLAQTFVAAPFYVRTAATAFAGLDRELEQAAAVDGAGPFAVFARITLPLAGPALLAGAVMTWARALGEFGATILFAGNFPGVTQTMPLAIYIGFEQDLGISITLSVILLAVSFAVLFLVKAALRQRVGAPLS